MMKEAGTFVMAKESTRNDARHLTLLEGFLSRRQQPLSHRASVLINLMVAALLYGLAFLAIVGVIRLVHTAALHL